MNSQNGTRCPEAPTKNQQLTGGPPLSCWVGADFTNSAVIESESAAADESRDLRFTVGQRLYHRIAPQWCILMKYGDSKTSSKASAAKRNAAARNREASGKHVEAAPPQRQSGP